MNTVPQNCPDIGAWRAWLDHEADLPDGSHHLDGCPGCRRLVKELRDDAAVAHDGLAILVPGQVPAAAEVALARERLKWRQAASRRAPIESIGRPTTARGPLFLQRFSTPWRVAAGGLAAALALAIVVAFTPEGSAAAAGFLAQFRSQQVQAIEITPQSQAEIMRSMNALSNLGTLKVPSAVGAGSPAAVARAESQQAHTATAAEAAQTVKFALLTPDPTLLPSGINATPTIRVSPGEEVRFTFDKNKARAYYQSTGHPEVSLPDKFDGAALVVTIPPAALLTYSGGGSARNDVIVAEAGELVVDVQGKVSLPEMRDFLLGLPGLPPAVVSQLKKMDSWSNTLPIPVPVDQVNWRTTTINGSQALLLDDNSGVGSAAVWHANGHLIGVAGTLKANDLTKVASSLAVR
jgi:hypothetical protein